MAVSLLEMAGGGVSLEFDDADLAKVIAAIDAQFGAIRTLEEAALHSDVEFGGERFLYYHEWSPCLISRSDKGMAMLRQIVASLP